MGILGGCLLVTGCSSGQKPASLGTAADSGASVGSGGTSASGGTPSGTGSNSATPSSGASSDAAVGGANGGTAAPLPAGPTTTALKNGLGTIVAQLPADPNGQAAITAYIQFMNVASQMDKTATFDTNLDNYADLNALAGVNAAVTNLRNKGQHFAGSFTAKPTVAAVAMTAKPLPLVTISVCYNNTKWLPVTAAGKPAPNPPKTGQYIVMFQVHQSGDGKWRVTDITAKADQKC